MAKAKWRNIKAQQDGYTFDSQLDLFCYRQALLELKAGAISALAVYPVISLTRAKIRYKADLAIRKPDGTVYWQENKGARGERTSGRFPTIKRLWAYYAPLPLHIRVGAYQGWSLVATELLMVVPPSVKPLPVLHEDYSFPVPMEWIVLENNSRLPLSNMG